MVQIPRFVGVRMCEEKPKSRKEKEKRNEEDEFICGFRRRAGAKCAKLYCMSSTRSSLRALLI